jgi:methylphosphotriester-DNA--protein-cysteine methyltransferase
MRCKAFFLLACFSLALLHPLAAEAKFYGSAKTKRYHQAYCRSAQKISAKSLRVFETGAQAKKKGYKPCKTCKPRDNP